MEINELQELIKSIRNRCYIADILIEKGRFELLPTVLEDLHTDSQTIALEYCVKETE